MLNIFIISAIGCFVGFSFFNVSTKIKTSFYKIKRLKALVSSQNEGRINIYWITFCIILKSFYISFLQRINKTVIKLDKNTWEISYIIDDKLYKIVVKKKRGPRDILSIIDDKKEDVTNLVLPYLGPGEDFYKSILTPDFFSKKSLTFNLSNGTEIIFKKTNLIEI